MEMMYHIIKTESTRKRSKKKQKGKGLMVFSGNSLQSILVLLHQPRK